MARQKAVDTKIQVTRGFVTEFTPVGFPQEAAIDIDNCVIDTDGSVRRRPGLDLEQGYSLNSINTGVLAKGDIETQAFTTHIWEFVANSGSLNIVVQQVGLILQFYAQIGAVSANPLGEIDLTTYAITPSELREASIEMTSGLGALFLVSEYLEPLKITYEDGLFVVTQITIEQRDFDGLEDNLTVEERPATLFRNHYYNLLNQGWTDENICTFAGISISTDLCAETGNVGGLAGVTTFPSNADIMTVGIVTNASGDLEFDPDFIREDYLGNTPAPRGHFILEAFAKDYDEVSGCPGTGSEITPTRPQAIAFHQGRIFYTSPVVQNRGNGIFYSQQLLSDDRAAKCYQEADPTAAEINDLIATDGGYLPIPGVGQIFRMQEFANGIVILASNGVWYLTGADVGSAVTAVNLRLDKIHASGALGTGNVVEAEGSLFYFGIEGIMQIALDELGSAKATNITQSSIQSFYVNIGAQARERASAVFIPEQRKIYWAYKDTTKEGTQSTKSYNRVLILDLDVKGFYKYSISESSVNNYPEIVGLSLVRPIAAGVLTTEVVTETDLTPITLTDGSTLTAGIVAEAGQISTVKVATVAYSIPAAGYKMTFSSFHSRAFTDWREFDPLGEGLPMDSFVEFAEFSMGALHTKGKPTYVHSYFSKASKNLAPGGYYELPPLYYASTGLRISQSIVEVLNKPSSNLRTSQSLIEVLLSPPSDFRVSQSLTETLWENDNTTYTDDFLNQAAGNLSRDCWEWATRTKVMIEDHICDFPAWTGLMSASEGVAMNIHAPVMFDLSTELHAAYALARLANNCDT